MIDMPPGFYQGSYSTSYTGGGPNPYDKPPKMTTPPGTPLFPPGLPNPGQWIQQQITGVEDWLIGAAASMVMPYIIPFVFIFVVGILLVAVVIGGGAFGMGLVIGDTS
jgi:hypothetical protein